MSLTDLDSVYAYATERGKEEMRYTIRSSRERETFGDRNDLSLPVTVLRVLAFLWTILVSR